MAGPHFHETEGGPQGSTQKTPEEQAEEIKAHVRKHKDKYKLVGAGLVGALLMRKFGRPQIHVEVPVQPDDILLVTTFKDIKKLCDQPDSYLEWAEQGKTTVRLITEAHPDIQ